MTKFNSDILTFCLTVSLRYLCLVGSFVLSVDLPPPPLPLPRPRSFHRRNIAALRVRIAARRSLLLASDDVTVTVAADVAAVTNSSERRQLTYSSTDHFPMLGESVEPNGWTRGMMMAIIRLDQ